jgi:hypothetical protein
MPGIGLEMLGAMQQAAQASRQAWLGLGTGVMGMRSDECNLGMG